MQLGHNCSLFSYFCWLATMREVCTVLTAKVRAMRLHSSSVWGIALRHTHASMRAYIGPVC